MRRVLKALEWATRASVKFFLFITSILSASETLLSLLSYLTGKTYSQIFPLIVVVVAVTLVLLCSEIHKNSPDLTPWILVLRKCALSVAYNRISRTTIIRTTNDPDMLYRIILVAVGDLLDLSVISTLKEFERWANGEFVTFRIMEDFTAYEMVFDLHNFVIKSQRGFYSTFPLRTDTYEFLSQRAIPSYNDIRDADMAATTLKAGKDDWIISSSPDGSVKDITLFVLDFHITYMEKVNRQKYVYLMADALEMIRRMILADTRISKIATIGATGPGIKFAEDFGFERMQLYKSVTFRGHEENWFFYVMKRENFIHLYERIDADTAAFVAGHVRVRSSYDSGDQQTLSSFRKFVTSVGRAAVEKM